MIARYDLGRELISFDFYNWLVMASAMGAREVVFGTKAYRKTNWTDAQCRQRFETIIAPGPAFAGLPCREGDDGESIWPTALRFYEFVAWVRENKFPRLRSILAPGGAIYTVTLRRQAEKPFRNSNEAAWRIFAADIGALVIEDHDDKPIDLRERLALYAGAAMNFGVACGPLFLCSLTDYPCMTFNHSANLGFLERSGIRYGEPMPWCGENQMTVWERDDLDVIRKQFGVWRETNTNGISAK